VPVICPSSQAKRLRQINATGKSALGDVQRCQAHL